MLTRPLYTGHICSETYDIHRLKGQDEMVISLETYERVQAGRKGTAQAPRRKNLPKDFTVRWFVLCGDCGEPYTACRS